MKFENYSPCIFAYQVVPIFADDEQTADTSKEFLKDFHAWMGRNASGHKQSRCLDGFAQTVFRQAAKAIQTFLSEFHGQMHEHYEQKLRYYDTEWLRFANACQRMEDFCRWKLQGQQDCHESHMITVGSLEKLQMIQNIQPSTQIALK